MIWLTVGLVWVGLGVVVALIGCRMIAAADAAEAAARDARLDAEIAALLGAS